MEDVTLCPHCLMQTTTVADGLCKRCGTSKNGVPSAVPVTPQLAAMARNARSNGGGGGDPGLGGEEHERLITLAIWLMPGFLLTIYSLLLGVMVLVFVGLAMLAAPLVVRAAERFR